MAKSIIIEPALRANRPCGRLSNVSIDLLGAVGRATKWKIGGGGDLVDLSIFDAHSSFLELWFGPAMKRMWIQGVL
jgi:hypothetical protein